MPLEVIRMFNKSKLSIIRGYPRIDVEFTPGDSPGKWEVAFIQGTDRVNGYILDISDPNDPIMLNNDDEETNVVEIPVPDENNNHMTVAINLENITTSSYQ